MERTLAVAQSRGRLLNLDILRFVSAMLVVFFHYGFRMQITGEGGGVGFSELAPVAMWLDVGLYIFFAISGYVITMSADARSAFDFGAGRFARLWPSYMLCAAITGLIVYHWPVVGIQQPSFAQWLSHIIIMSRALGQPFMDGVYWTIVYEIIFYGWVFAFIWLGWFERHWKTIILVWMSLSFLNEAIIDSGIIQKLFITEYSGLFAFGLALYRTMQQRSRSAAFVLMVTVLWSVIAPIFAIGYFQDTYGISRPIIGILMLGGVSVMVVTLCALAPNLPVRMDIAMMLGGLTYPLYLLHQHIGYAVFTRFAADENRWIVLVALLAALLAVSWWVGRYFEPLLRKSIVRSARRIAARFGGNYSLFKA